MALNHGREVHDGTGGGGGGGGGRCHPMDHPLSIQTIIMWNSGHWSSRFSIQENFCIGPLVFY